MKKGGKAMPLYLIRQDITRMDCDAIVNPSNPDLIPGGGLDAAIHRAAGPALSAACQALGGCDVGEAKPTEAFRLPCRWVIHTAGPVWRGGQCGERASLERCYRSCFARALEQGCQSLAIPLIGAGSNGVPETQVLSVALETLEDCLNEAEMTVYLVVFGKEAYALSKQLRDDVQSYIDDHYAQSVCPPSFGNLSPGVFDRSKSAPMRATKERSFPFRRRQSRDEDAAPEQVCSAEILRSDGTEFLEDFHTAGLPDPLQLTLRLDEPFSVKLLRLIDQKGMDDVACYKKANVSRQTWYKILNEKDYKPNKKTVLSFAVALELTLDETQTLLESVGFVLSGSNLFDVILMYCLSHGIYSVTTIDAILFQYDQETLYSKA